MNQRKVATQAPPSPHLGIRVAQQLIAQGAIAV